MGGKRESRRIRDAVGIQILVDDAASPGSYGWKRY